jgi:ketosteroid isomerase-like protein
MSGDPIEIIKALDQCWSEGRFDDLAELLAPDIVVVGSHGNRFVGRDKVLEGYRDFRAAAEVKLFKPDKYQATTRGDAALVEYEWTMQWTSKGQNHDARGREILALSRQGGDWKIFWRTQIHLP